MTGSKLVSAVYPADKSNYTAGRKINGAAVKISEITVHHMGGINTARGCGKIFAAPGRGGSSHYGIGTDGEIAQYVSEGDTSWANDNWASNCRAVTIEVSNDMREYPWHVSDASLFSLVRLISDIALRNNIYPLIAGKNLTWHSMYAATICPGDYIRNNIEKIASMANAIIKARKSQGDNKAHDWSECAVDWALMTGVMQGDESGNLHLSDTITREEAAVMLYRAIQLGGKLGI